MPAPRAKTRAAAVPAPATSVVAARILLTLATTLAIAMLALVQAAQQVRAQPRASEFTLSNGMQVVVIPDHRAPVVTHMVWYKVGAADEPAGVSGIAHFLEHLMFKSTEKIPMGEFSKIVARLGGQDNAFTSQDVTAYFQRIAKAQLPKVMEMEADRMVNLKLTEKEVLTERDVILEERRSRVENNPSSILDEQMDAALYISHPYNTPVIGWEHEIARLTPADAMSYYKRYYAPNNAILVVSGDVTAGEVRTLAEQTYGKLKANSKVGGPRVRPTEPPHRAARRLELKDARAGKASLHRYYLTPSYTTAEKGEAEALDLLMKIVGGGSTSRLYKSLVVEQHVASSASGWYSGGGLDSGKIGLYAIGTDAQSLEKIEAAIDAVLKDVRDNGVTQAELDRAKSSFLADYIYESDSQNTLARRYGWALTVGRTLADVESWPDAVSKVTLDDVKRAASKHLDIRRSVTGRMLPEAPETASSGEAASAKPRT
jgi:zinc protease